MKDLNELDGTRWVGTAELWLDPLGDHVQQSACTLSVTSGSVDYTWSHEGKSHEGRLETTNSGANFIDTFHSAVTMACERVRDSWALLAVFGTYSAGEGPPWGWRIALCHRAPLDELVLQMTNVAPWGEEARAVRMTFRRA